MEKMTASERIRNLIRGKSIDRLPIIEWAPYWDKTVIEWRKHGLPVTADSYGIQEFFGLDKCVQTLFMPWTDKTPTAKSFGAGIITDEADYREVKKVLYPDPETMLSKERLQFLEKTHAAGDTIHFFTVSGFFWFPRDLFGIERHLFSFYDQPELLHEICRDNCEWLKKVFAYIKKTFKYDFMSFQEDMSYNNGPMLSKECFDEFLAPYYRELIPILKEMDVPVFVDSDGDITKAVDWYAEVGVEGMFPLERQAGVDVSLYIEKQPQMTFMGHFDKMCMKFGEEAMRKEFERLLPSAQKGKLIIGVDHQTPPDVTIENYRTYIRLFREYAAKCAR